LGGDALEARPEGAERGATQSMGRPFKRQVQRRACRRAAALEDAQPELAGGGLERDAQAGG
jgi:hypothetical protein